MAETKMDHARYVYVMPCGMTITGTNANSYRDVINHRAYCPRCKSTTDSNMINAHKDGSIDRPGGASFRAPADLITRGGSITRVRFDDGFIPPWPVIDKIVYGQLTRESGGTFRVPEGDLTNC